MAVMSSKVSYSSVFFRTNPVNISNPKTDCPKVLLQCPNEKPSVCCIAVLNIKITNYNAYNIVLRQCLARNILTNLKNTENDVLPLFPSFTRIWGQVWGLILPICNST